MTDETSDKMPSARMRLLADAASLLETCLDQGACVAKVGELIVPRVADLCTVDLFDDEGRLRRAGTFHADPAKLALVRELDARYPPEASRSPAVMEALRSRTPFLQAEIDDASLVVAARDEDHLRMLRELGPRSSIVVPLHARERLLGLVRVSLSSSERAFTTRDLRWITELGRKAALALDNARMYESERRSRARAESAERRLRLLDDATKVLFSSFELEPVLQRTCGLVVPVVADLCAVFLLEDDRLVLAAAAHADRGLQADFVRAHRRAPFGLEGADGPSRAAREGCSMLVPRLSDDVLAAWAQDGRHLEDLMALDLRSCVLAPLKAAGRVSGVLLLADGASGRELEIDDLRFADELAAHAALAHEHVRLKREADRALKIRDEVLNVASHDLKTPLVALHLRLQVLARKLPRAPDSFEDESFGILMRQVDRLVRLVDALLDAARISEGKLSLELETCDLADVVDDSLARVHDMLDEAGCTVVAAIERPVVGIWDRTRLEQVLSNLLSNAMKYGRGAPVEISLRAYDDVARLVVRDHGVGIAPREHERIFQRFERAEDAPRGGGFGLGLWIVRQIVEAHGGRVRVESDVGAGARFIVELPRLPHPPR